MLVLMPIHVILAHLDMYTMIKVISVKLIYKNRIFLLLIITRITVLFCGFGGAYDFYGSCICDSPLIYYE